MAISKLQSGRLPKFGLKELIKTAEVFLMVIFILHQSHNWQESTCVFPAQEVHWAGNRLHRRLYSAPQYSAVQYSAVQYSALHCSGMQLSEVECSAVHYSGMQLSAVECGTVPVRYSAVNSSGVQCSGVQFSSVQFSEVQFSSV